MGKHLQTVAAMACMKTLLMIFNIVFWISGFAIMAVGIWMEMDLMKYMELSTEFSGTAPYVLIGTGALIIVIGSLACCCTVKGQPVLLYVYSAFLAIVFILELGGGISIYAYRTKLTAGFDKGLNQTMTNYRNAPISQRRDFDFLQEHLHCCGNHKYSDWINMNPPIPVPLSCCIEPNCDTADPDVIYQEGCYERVIDFINANIGYVAGTAIGIAFFPLLGLFLSCCLANTVNKAKYEQMA